MEIDFKDKRILITGGTRGIGRQIAEDMASLGGSVTITGTSCAYEPFGVDIDFYEIDFLDDKSIKNFTSFIEDEKFDVCINNAGINRIDPICDITTKDWNDILCVNLSTPFKILRAISCGMKNRKYGRIVNVASIWASVSIPHRACYSSSKSGLLGLTRSAAAELAPYNVLINTVSPGFTLTELTEQILGQEKMKEICETIPMNRMAHPAEISKVVLFVASDMNTYISGQDIVVDGGFVNV